MTSGTRKISVRLDADLYAQLQRLVNVHPQRSLSAVIGQAITGGLSKSSFVETRAYLEGAVANLAVILELLSGDVPKEDETAELLKHFYGLLLEMAINIDGVEA